jgi:hypothetical protein
MRQAGRAALSAGLLALGLGCARPLPIEATDPLAAALAGLSGDDATAREAQDQLAAMGEAAIPALEALLKDPSPEVRARARDALGRITGQWGGGAGIIWKRSVAEAVGGDKPLMVLHLFGRFDEEFC